ncbi:hypothetical protein [Tenacibaculum aiptasiae]|uniref:hypothetical protein n=1 Tax=Tenacibaculum aiptasiae TaxID=426481 RepID=UPI002330172A|nr:hypothetical protein [Tenacibaculum aiptasiae]
MKKLLTIIFSFIISICFSQSKSDINNLLDEISKIENSKEITNTKEAKKLLEYGSSTLPILAELFTDETRTSINSDCHNRNLNKGEVAIIIADKIHSMPYFILTGFQNCLMTFCEGNPNLIEYYFPKIIDLGVDNFQKKYNKWLLSEKKN